MNNSRIIAFAGRKRAGKSMLANAVKKFKPNTVIISIADNLKILCAELLNVSLERLNAMKDDGTFFDEKFDGRWVSILNQHTKISNDVICKELGGRIFTNVREVLQCIGTDFIRKHIPNWHIDKTIERIKIILDNKAFDGYVVVDDVRFPNERCAIENIGGDVFFVIRPNCFNVSNHQSETALKYYNFDTSHVIINDMPKDAMFLEFNMLYFDGYEKSSILLSNNPWYEEHVIDIKTQGTKFDVDRRKIIKLVLDFNIDKPQFNYNGIITFENSDTTVLNLFRRIIMGLDKNYHYHTYTIYNPLTNEILKEYM